METKNAIITAAEIHMREGFLTVDMSLAYGGLCQAVGGYALYLPRGYSHFSENRPFAGHYITRCMEVAGVTSWADMRGRPIRVQADDNHVFSLGHIINDDWFHIATDITFFRLNFPGEKK